MAETLTVTVQKARRTGGIGSQDLFFGVKGPEMAFNRLTSITNSPFFAINQPMSGKVVSGRYWGCGGGMTLIQHGPQRASKNKMSANSTAPSPLASASGSVVPKEPKTVSKSVKSMAPLPSKSPAQHT